MATQLHRILDNFYWRIEAIDPTSDLCARDRFFRIDPTQLHTAESAGLERGFYILRTTSGADEAVTDQYQRVASHRFDLVVCYAATHGIEEAQRLMCQDRNDLIDCLRDDQKYIGFSDEDTTLEMGLIDRIRTSDEFLMDIDSPVFTMRMTWECRIREVE
jgi:hypothetical protein